MVNWLFMLHNGGNIQTLNSVCRESSWPVDHTDSQYCGRGPHGCSCSCVIRAPGGPSARSGHRMVVYKKNIIVFGGFHDNIRYLVPPNPVVPVLFMWLEMSIYWWFITMSAVTPLLLRWNYHSLALSHWYNTGLILGLCPANERRRYFVTTSLIGCAQA